jgi:hypothetical protein
MSESSDSGWLTEAAADAKPDTTACRGYRIVALHDTAHCVEKRSATCQRGQLCKDTSMTEHHSRILQGIDIHLARGLEIGPLVWPIVRKSEGNITYVDHADTETLRRKYANDPGVPGEQIVEVDAVWGAQTLVEAVGGRKFEYIVASHVVEHIPDLIGWICELVAVLAPGGEIRPVVPDGRYTFDHLRRETVLADVLAAHAVRARVPQPQQVVEFVSNFAAVGVVEAWEGKRGQPPALTLEHAQQWLSMAREAAKGTYHDVHCWVFTPRSWGALMADLGRAGLLACECSGWWNTLPGTYEFGVGMRVGDDVVGSWEAMAAPEATDVAPQLAEVAALRVEVSALRCSTSWRVTAPLRWMRRALWSAVKLPAR